MKECLPIGEAWKASRISWENARVPWWERRSQVIPVPETVVRPIHNAIITSLPIARDDQAVIAATHPPALVGISVYPDARTDARVWKPAVQFIMDHPLIPSKDRSAFFRGYTWLTEVGVGATTKRVITALQKRQGHEIPAYLSFLSNIIRLPVEMTAPIRDIKAVKQALAPFLSSKPFLSGLAEGLFVGRTGKLESVCRRMGYESIADVCIHIGRLTGKHDYARIDTKRYGEIAGYGSWSGIITISSTTLMLAPIYQALLGYSLNQFIERPSVIQIPIATLSGVFAFTYVQTMAGYFLDSIIHEYLHYFSEAEGRDGLLRGKLIAS